LIMKLPHPLPRAAALVLLAASALAQAGTQVGVNVTVHEPGFYGRVEIGQQPPPRVIYPQPVIIQQTPIAVVQRPIYMRVPPEHSRRWAYFCARYRACGQPVYFVDGPLARGLHQWRRDNRERWEAARDAYDQKREDQMQDRYERRGDGRGYERGDDRHDHGRGKGHGHRD
jgi:hypothetical protein